MPSTFFGLTIASSGLSAYQAALNTSANNISNSQTEGYSRQTANIVASSALRVSARYGTMGSGVTVTSITQTRNSYYDTRYWYNQSSVGLWEKRLDYLQQIEEYFTDDDSTTGFSSILDTMFNALDTLKTNASDTSVRQQFIASVSDLASYLNSTAEGLAEIQESANEEVKATVANINSIAEKIAVLNKEINVIELQGGYANELRDERALLIDELSELVSVEVTETAMVNDDGEETGGTYYRVKINGEMLVDTFNYSTLECVARDNKVNQSDVDGLYDIIWSDTGNTFDATSSSASGSLKALMEIRDGNNGDNFTGTVSAVTSTSVTISNPSITTVAAMTMPENGTLTINGKEYTYSGFSYETDEDGNITSYTFQLDETLSKEQQSKINGKTAAIGDSVEAMGVPYYQAQLNEFLRSFCTLFNDILKQGNDLNGDSTDYYAFLTGTDTVTGEEYAFDDITTTSSSDTYYKLTASNICVSSVVVKDPSLLGLTAEDIEEAGVDAYDLVEELALLKSDTVIFRGSSAADFLSCMISDISVDTSEANIFYENYSNITSTIDTLRMSVSGVDTDEEALDLVKFQNAYNLCSKMVSVMAEIYDRLILETGV